MGNNIKTLKPKLNPKYLRMRELHEDKWETL